MLFVRVHAVFSVVSVALKIFASALTEFPTGRFGLDATKSSTYWMRLFNPIRQGWRRWNALTFASRTRGRA